MFKENPNTILFSYRTEELLDLIAANSTYATKNIRNENGKAMIDSFAVTADEEAFIKTHLKDAACQLFVNFVKMSRVIPNSFFFDELKEDPEDAKKEASQVGFEIVREMKDADKPAYNVNRLPLIDQNCKDYMVNFVLSRWAETNKQADEITIRASIIAHTERALIGNLFDIRKPAYGKSYSITKQ